MSWQMQRRKSSVVVERSNGPSHACTSSNLAVLGSAVPCFFQVWSRAQARAGRAREQSRVAQSSRAEQGDGRNGASFFPIPVSQFLIVDRLQLCSASVFLLPPRYLVCCGLSDLLFQSWTAWAYRFQYFCGLDFLSGTQTHVRTHDTSGLRARPPLRHNRLLTTFNFFSLPARWFFYIRSPPPSAPPFALLSKHAAESRRSAA